MVQMLKKFGYLERIILRMLINAKYSILFAGEQFDLEIIGIYLKRGLKIIWFGSKEEVQLLNNQFSDYKKAGFLCTYENNKNIKIKIIDGANVISLKNEIYSLEKGDESFNAKQYMVEHYPIDRQLIIEAGAGSGKTHVMIDRILFLMHICEDFQFSKVAMITFTNKATDNMRHRLIKVLNSKYELTGNTIYLDRIEEFSQININTIHSFFKEVIVEVSPMLGYGTGVQIRSYEQEKKELLRDLLDKQYKQNGKRVEDVIGLPLHDIEKLALEYWEKLDNNGISEEEVQNLNWGKTSEEQARKIQSSLKNIFAEVDEKYNHIKYINNAISMKDIIHELSKTINRSELGDYISKKYQFIFCDEFQDSDNVQIQTIAVLNKIYSGRLFVVGDIKQSIYRFRGATDSAFSKLIEQFDEKEKKFLIKESLVKNYRTSNDIMNILNQIFEKWSSRGFKLLQYEESLVPTLTEQNGTYRQIAIKEESRQKELIKLIRQLQNNDENSEIVCLTRNNSQLRTIKQWCEEEKIACMIREKGAFFQSQAVLDFCALVEALYFGDEPAYMFNYLESAYNEKHFSASELKINSGDKNAIKKNIKKYIDVDKWQLDRLEIRNKPVLAVLRRIVEEKNPVRNYALKRKSELLGKKYPESIASEQAIIDTNQYDANLRKLLQMLTEQFSGDFSSLGDVCEYLRLKILTDRDEETADAVGLDQRKCVQGYTVHGAKGLEFENVILPFMNDVFYQAGRSEILISKDRKQVGWIYRGKEGIEIKNDNYDLMLEEETSEVAKEETRLLYVAMTRAISGLYCMPVRKYSGNAVPQTWAELLPKERDDA